MIIKCLGCNHLFLKEYIDLHNHCQKCALKREGLKECRLCGHIKPLEEFRILKKGGVRSYCRPCENKMINNGKIRRKKEKENGI